MKKTFADRAKQIMNKYKKRLGDNFDKGDKLALEAMNQELEALRQEQEAVRMAAGIAEAEQAQGLPLHAYGDFLTGKRYRLKTVEKKGKDGDLPEYNLGGILSNFKLPSFGSVREKQQFLANSGFSPGAIDNQDGARTQLAMNDYMNSIAGGRMQNIDPTMGPMAQRRSFTDTMWHSSPDVNMRPKELSVPNPEGKKGLFAPMEEGSTYKSRVPWMGAAAGIVGNLLMNKKIDLPTYDYQEYTPDKVGANLVNFGREREQVMNERDLAQQMIANNARGTGSMAGLMDNIQAGATGTQREAGTRFGQSLQNEGTMNAQIQNQADQFNASQGLAAAGMNERNRMFAKNMERENSMINADRKDARTKGIMDSVTGYFRDRMRADQYDNQMAMMTPDNYKAVTGKDSWLRNLLQINPNMNMQFQDTGDVTSSPSAAYGGQLSNITLFGDDEYERIMMRASKFKNKQSKNK